MRRSSFMDAREIARRLGCHVDTFLSKRRELESEGFPKPVSSFRRPLRWRRAQVRAWLDGEVPATTHADEPTAGNIHSSPGTVVSFAEILRQRSSAGL